MEIQKLLLWIVINVSTLTMISSQSLLQVDQDLGSFTNQDRNYTMGFEFGWESSRVNDFFKKRRSIIGVLGSALAFQSIQLDPDMKGYYSIGVVAFTPDSLNSTLVQYGDRPYSSLFYNRFSLLAFDESAKLGIDTYVWVGMLGLHVAEYFQTAIHTGNRAWNNKDTPYDPLGWNNQISNHGELTFDFAFNLRRLVKDSKYLSLRWDYGFNLGLYQRSINSNGIVVIGESAISVMNQSGGVIASNTSADVDYEKGHYMYLIANYNPYYVFKNQSISGGFRESIHTEEERKVVHNFRVGLNYEYVRRNEGSKKAKKFHQFKLLYNWKTNEFVAGIDNKRNHQWWTFFYQSSF